VIALDTNVVIRFLLQDDKAQSARAARLFNGAAVRGDRLFLSDIVLCEVVWVLHSRYRLPRADVAQALANLFQAEHLSFRDIEGLTRALAAFRSGKGDFADYLIREHAREVGCETVRTFDKPLLKEDGFIAA
jgi:predicted nucleic-acid-binding protein